jgi:hypothetical protein
LSKKSISDTKKCYCQFGECLHALCPTKCCLQNRPPLLVLTFCSLAPAGF